MYFQNMFGSLLKRLTLSYPKVVNLRRRPDKGTDILNESFWQYLKKKDIRYCTAKNGPKASVVVRVNWTLKI